jgi:hypothetical protein
MKKSGKFEKAFVAYIAFWAIVCFAGGIALLKNSFEVSILPFLGGLFLFGMGTVYAGMFFLGLRALRRPQKPEEDAEE